jgi:hypothetical protein
LGCGMGDPFRDGLADTHSYETGSSRLRRVL